MSTDQPRSDSFGSRGVLTAADDVYEFFRIDAVEGARRLPFSLKVLLENMLRNEAGGRATAEHVRAVAGWDPAAEPATEIQFSPARVLLQDFAGVPTLVNLATMRDAMVALGRPAAKVDPQLPVELVIDHSVVADTFGTRDALARNIDIEYERNAERYQFRRWGQQSFANLVVIPPGTGIVHQVNLEHLARVVFAHDGLAYPDTVIGTDSHTTMVNGLGVLGWGVGGIEAEAAMLGQPVSMLIPRVVGVRLTGELPTGSTATDLVLTITALLRRHGVVGKFVEFYGEGIASVPLANRATIGNMSPEYGSTCAIFPIDDETLRYLRLTGRDPKQIALVEAYAKEQGLWHDPTEPPRYSEYVELDLTTVVPSLAGPKRPQDTVPLAEAKRRFRTALGDAPGAPTPVRLEDGSEHRLDHGAVVIAAITSCTNTSNPSLMVAAGLLARNAVERGLQRKPWVKTTLAPGSTVVTGYYERAGLTPYLEKLGFHVIGYGCTTCVGNSGPLPGPVSEALKENDLAGVAVLSGNRNFEARVHPDVKMNYLASPPLVVAYALAGTMDIDILNEPLGLGSDGTPVFLADIWPSQEQVQQTIDSTVSAELFRHSYTDLSGDERWRGLATPTGDTYAWDAESTYLRRPPFLDGLPEQPLPVPDIRGARVLAMLGDSVTTDHISPVSAISASSPAANYLTEHGVAPRDFSSYGARRGNHEVMMRGTFANRRLRNQIAEGTEGGFTRDFTRPDAPVTTIFDAALAYRAAGTPLIVLAGAEYGSGSSRDWAAKGPALLGVRAVIAQSFERIHRSNLIGMGILPLQFAEGESAQSLGLSGAETFDVEGIEALNTGTTVGSVAVTATAADGRRTTFTGRVRLDTPGEYAYYRHGGIMPFVLRSLASRD